MSELSERTRTNPDGTSVKDRGGEEPRFALIRAILRATYIGEAEQAHLIPNEIEDGRYPGAWGRRFWYDTVFRQRRGHRLKKFCKTWAEVAWFVRRRHRTRHYWTRIKSSSAAMGEGEEQGRGGRSKKNRKDREISRRHHSCKRR